jgi:hypothetical protein
MVVPLSSLFLSAAFFATSPTSRTSFWPLGSFQLIDPRFDEQRGCPLFAGNQSLGPKEELRNLSLL